MSSNIFDEAGRKKPVKKKKVIGKKPLEPIVTEPVDIDALNLDPEIAERYKQAKAQQEEITAKLDAISQSLGMSISELKLYLSNKGNFKESEWLFIQSQKALLDKEFQNLAGNERDQKRAKNVELSKETKKRKGKSVGARKKWIPMP